MKEQKIKEYQKMLLDTKQAILRAEELFGAVANYDKKTINKRFFEKFFTLKHDKTTLEYAKDAKEGDARVSWKGDILTDFHFCDKAWNWATYYKRVFLANGEYIEVDNDLTEELKTKTWEKIKELCERAGRYEKTINEYEQQDEQAILNDLKAIYIKYNKPKNWTELLDEVKHLN